MGRLLIQFPGTNTTKALSETLPKNVIIVDEDLHELHVHDGVTPGGHIVGGSSAGGGYHPDLFDWKWADHQLNDAQWLRADTYSWQSGAVYQVAYQHLFDDIYFQAYAWYDSDNDRTCYTTSETPEVGDDTYANSGNSLINRNDDIVSISGDSITTNNGYTWQRKAESDLVMLNVSEHTETIAGTTIIYYPATDGHRIVLADQESNVSAIYNATGVAWYYILDTTNQRFKLPRTQYGVTGLRDIVGKYVPESLPNLTGTVDWNNGEQGHTELGTATGVFNKIANTSKNYPSKGGTSSAARGFTFDASLSSSTYQDDAPVQQRATQQYLYFYVGEFTQTAIENTAGLNAELFNDKVDVGHEVIAFQAPTAGNNYTWYRKYADGWVEQGGMVTETSTVAQKSIVFPVEMADTNYNLQVTLITDTNSNNPTYYAVGARTKSATGFTCYAAANFTKDWKVCGMAA